MSEAGDYTPAAYWGGHDFKSARREYDDHVTSSFGTAVAKNVDAKSLVPENLACDAEAPLIIAVDVTGSMGDWPATMFSKLPYLEHEGKEYLGEDMKICFAAIGDAYSDRYALQVREFCDGAKLKDELKELIIEGGGGGQTNESYELAACYFANNVQFPVAIRKPILIIVGDEGLYGHVDADQAERLAKVELDQRLTTPELFAQLKQDYAVYLIRKPYGYSGGDGSDSTNMRIQEQWEGLLGGDHVVMLPDANRVVDVIFGILAKETGRIEYFEEELKDRQGKDKDGKAKIEVVLKSIRSVHTPSAKAALPPPKASKSVTKRKTDSKLKGSKSLLDDED